MVKETIWWNLLKNTNFRSIIKRNFKLGAVPDNEEKNIVPTLKNIIEAKNQTGVSYEILVTDDKSQDDTVCVVENFICESPGIPTTLIKNKKIPP